MAPCLAAKDCDEDVLVVETENALAQIRIQQYESELLQHDIANKLYVAVVFSGKRLKLKYHSELSQSFDRERQRREYQASKSPKKLSPILVATQTTLSINSSIQSNPISIKDNKIKRALEYTKDVTNVIEQILGVYEDREILFDVFETKGDTSCGYHCLPAPYNRENVTELLLAQTKNTKVRASLAPEIFDAFRTGNLPSFIKEKYNKDLDEIANQFAQSDHEQQIVLSSILDVIDSNHIIPDRSLEGTIQYLQSLMDPNKTHQTALENLLKLQSNWDILQSNTMTFFNQENVFEDFVKNYIGGTGYLSFSFGSVNFKASTSLIDILLELISPPIRLVIWEKTNNSSNKAQIVYQGGHGNVIHMQHRKGHDTHFELMAESQLPLTPNKSLLTQFTNTVKESLQGSAKKPRLASDENNQMQSNEANNQSEENIAFSLDKPTV